jgi:asparagine synthase (glutamine-hydrolysing)
MINRTKRGYAIPRARWIREELRPLIMETLVANNAWLNFHLDQKQISRIVKRHMDGSNHDATIWTLLMLELWAQKWLND